MKVDSNYIMNQNQDDSFFLRETNDNVQLSMINETTSSNSKSKENSSVKFTKLKTQVVGKLYPSKNMADKVKEAQEVSRNNSQLDIDHLKFGNSQLNISQSSISQHIKSNVRGMALTNKLSTTLKMLNDKEKFFLARNNCLIDVLLELIQSNDSIAQRSNSTYEHNYLRQSSGIKNNNQQKFRNSYLGNTEISSQNGQQDKKDNQLSTSMFSASNNGEMHSDLRKEWMSAETLVSHCAINQLTYILIQKKKEVKLHLYYATDQQNDQIQELVELRRMMINNFEQQKTIEKRIQRYILMADETGIQSSFYLLFQLSDDEVKAPHSYECGDGRSSMSSLSSPPTLEKQSSIISSASRLKKLESNQKQLQKDFKTGWFKKQINMLIEAIEHVFCDMTFSKNTVRLAILLMGNLNSLSRPHIKIYVKKKPTYTKMLHFFDLERANMSEDEIVELENVLKNFYSPRELYGLTKRQKQIQKIKDNAYTKQDEISPRNKANLIRTDSLESLIDLVEQEKQLQQSSIYEHIVSEEKMNEIAYSSYPRKTGSLGPQSQKLFLKQEKSKFQMNFTNKHETTFEEFGTFGQQHELQIKNKLGNNHVIGSPPSQRSGLSNQRHQNYHHKKNDSQQCLTQGSHTLRDGTPVETTFLDMKESMLLKDRSFHFKNREQPEDNKGGTLVSNYGAPKYNRIVNTLNPNDNKVTVQDNKTMPRKNNTSTTEYDKLNLSNHKILGQSNVMMNSTQINTKISSKKLKNIDNIRTQNQIDDANQPAFCCFSFGNNVSAKKKRSKREKNSKSSLTLQHINQTEIQNQMEVFRAEHASSINSILQCQHKKSGEICDECQVYENQKKLTKEKLNECVIF